MVNSVERLLQVQEDHPRNPTFVHIQKDLVDEIKNTGCGGVALPEPELGVRQYRISCQITIYLCMYYTFQYFAT